MERHDWTRSPLSLGLLNRLKVLARSYVIGALLLISHTTSDAISIRMSGNRAFPLNYPALRDSRFGTQFMLSKAVPKSPCGDCGICSAPGRIDPGRRGVHRSAPGLLPRPFQAIPST